MAEGARWPQVTDPHLILKGSRGRNDFTKNRPDGAIRKWTGVGPNQSRHQIPLPTGHIDGAASSPLLHVTHLPNQFSSIVEQSKQLPIGVINRFAQGGKLTDDVVGLLIRLRAQRFSCFGHGIIEIGWMNERARQESGAKKGWTGRGGRIRSRLAKNAVTP